DFRLVAAAVLSGRSSARFCRQWRRQLQLWGAQASLLVSAASRNLLADFSSASCRRMQASSLRSPRKKQLRQLLYGSHFATIIGQPIGHGLGILAKDTLALHTADFASALVIAGLNSRESFRAVHYVPLVIVRDLVGQIRTVYQHVKMIAIGRRRIFRIAPTFGFEMQAKHQIRL